MKQLYPDLWQTEPEHPIPGAPMVSTHAYLLSRDEGNVLFYNSSHEDELRHIRELGGITHQYLSHEDEVGPALVRIREMFGSALCCHRLEEAAVRKVCPVDLTFEKREVHLGNIEVIPTPGHTPGSTCFFVSSPHGKTYLFTGDTIVLTEDGSWQNGFLPGISSKVDLKRSLELLRGLEPDVVIPSASEGRIPFREVSRAEWHSAVDTAAAGLS
jgi:hydroxyacylglutathione hydrolase